MELQDRRSYHRFVFSYKIIHDLAPNYLKRIIPNSVSNLHHLRRHRGTRFFFYSFLCPGTTTTHADSINSDLQRELDRRLRHTTLNTEQRLIHVLSNLGIVSFLTFLIPEIT